MRHRLLAVLALAGLVGCSEPEWQTQYLGDALAPLSFDLVDERGRRVDEEDYRGRVVLLFFGYTHCPDVCPMTLSRLAGVVSELDAALRDDLRVLFVSVDPSRDDAETLRDYTAAFGERFVGLTGDVAALGALTERYHVNYAYGRKNAAGDYAVSHSSAVFAFTREGEGQLLIRMSDPMPAVVNDLQRLLAQG